jgi:hydrogenase maturation protein HypF
MRAVGELIPLGAAAPAGVTRRVATVRGIVQGVGLRPFVHRLACGLGLRGSVHNSADGVSIAVEGVRRDVDEFMAAFRSAAPSLADIEALDWVQETPRGDADFRIAPSREDSPAGEISLCPDLATCEDCLEELFSPGDRRHRYAFVSCTRCGPRLTIARSAPYDRERTAMAEFAMCEACREEYADPASRRFHAQANACPACGPRLGALDAAGHPLLGGDPVRCAARALQQGGIVALKGLGGYHLACAASDEAAVAALRRRKQRDAKPFAVMAADVAVARTLCELGPEEERLLCSPARPIVLAQRSAGAGVASGVAPGSPLLGVLLPYTPLHHLLLREMAGAALVMTSGNRCGEPMLADDREAVERLMGVADLFLVHDRAVVLRCDDSVARVAGAEPVVLRRARGHAPRRQPLPEPCLRPVLALGGHLKATFALGRGARALLSHHVGDLGEDRTYRAYGAAIAHYEGLFRFAPGLLVHDLHPEYASTLYAEQRARTEGLPRLAVQHHHAHMASCMAEHGLRGPVLAVVFDGAGHGSDGAIWGGEFLAGDLRSFSRVGQLRYVPLPGGARAVREPWRMALAQLADAGEGHLEDELLGARVPAAERRTVRRMIEARLCAPPCSSMGRLFDAVAALLGLHARASFEGQAAIALEHAAGAAGAADAYPFELAREEERWIVDTRPLVRSVARDRARGIAVAIAARRFHETVAEVIEEVCRRVRTATALDCVVLSGGVFQNALLRQLAQARLASAGFRVHAQRSVPTNDGGLALGQLAIAAAAQPELLPGTPS